MDEDADSDTITLALATAIAVIEAALSRPGVNTSLESLRDDMERLFGARCDIKDLFHIQRDARQLVGSVRGGASH